MSMKKIIFTLIVLVDGLFLKTDAQYLIQKASFSEDIVAGPAPYAKAVWVGPEWVWKNKRYVEMPGYWAKGKGDQVWIPGYWTSKGRKYKWIPGRWK